jgi:hypothetical protein
MTIRDHLERWYFTLWGCRRDRHRMKFSGCMYCGAGGKQQPKFYL